MVLDGFKCPLPKVQSIEKWIEKGETEGNCPSCLISPLSSYYLGTLREAGEGKLAKELEAVFNKGDVLTIAQKLDNIKGEVGKALRAELKELDCFAQVFKQNDEAN